MLPDFPSHEGASDVFVQDVHHPDHDCQDQIWYSLAAHCYYPLGRTPYNQPGVYSGVTDWKYEHISCATLEEAQNVIALHQLVMDAYRHGLGPDGLPVGPTNCAWRLLTEGIPPGLAVYHQLYGLYPVELARFVEHAPARGFFALTEDEHVVPLSMENPYLLEFHHPFHAVWFLRSSRWGYSRRDAFASTSLTDLTVADVIRHKSEELGDKRE